MKVRHDGDCTIYASLSNGRPEDGICTCGYGLEYKRENGGNESEMYSEELQKRLAKRISKKEKDLTRKIIMENLGEREKCT